MFLNIQIDLLILRHTMGIGQFTLTTKKLLHIILNVDGVVSALFCRPIVAVASYCGMIKLWQYRKRYVPDNVVFFVYFLFRVLVYYKC